MFSITDFITVLKLTSSISKIIYKYTWQLILVKHVTVGHHLENLNQWNILTLSSEKQSITMASFGVYTFTYGCAQAQLKSYIKIYTGLLNFLEDSMVVSRWDLLKINVLLSLYNS